MLCPSNNCCANVDSNSTFAALLPHHSRVYSVIYTSQVVQGGLLSARLLPRVEVFCLQVVGDDGCGGLFGFELELVGEGYADTARLQ